MDDPWAITRTSAFGDKTRLASVVVFQVPVIKTCGSSPFSNSTGDRQIRKNFVRLDSTFCINIITYFLCCRNDTFRLWTR